MAARDVLILLAIVVVARVLFAYVLVNSQTRHARYRMRARLARWIWDGKLTPARAKRGKLVLPMSRAKRGAAAKRAKLLSVVRRGDAPRDTADSA